MKCLTGFWNDHSNLMINRSIPVCQYVFFCPKNYAIINLHLTQFRVNICWNKNNCHVPCAVHILHNSCQTAALSLVNKLVRLIFPVIKDLRQLSGLATHANNKDMDLTISSPKCVMKTDPKTHFISSLQSWASKLAPENCHKQTELGDHVHSGPPDSHRERIQEYQSLTSVYYSLQHPETPKDLPYLILHQCRVWHC